MDKAFKATKKNALSRKKVELILNYSELFPTTLSHELKVMMNLVMVVLEANIYCESMQLNT